MGLGWTGTSLYVCTVSIYFSLMIKLLICKTATVLFGVLAIGILARLHTVAHYLQNGDLIGAILGLIGAIFGTQWFQYQKRSSANPSRTE